MAINTYATLKTAVANWLAKTNLTSYIPDFIVLAEARINREFRLRTQETALDETISAGTIDVPSDYLELKHAYINSTPVQWLERKEPEYIYRQYPVRSADARPKIICREMDKFVFGPYPDSAYQVKGIYYRALAALALDGDTNWLLTNHPQVYLFAALGESEAFNQRDERIELWEAKYEREAEFVKLADKKERYSGSILASRPQ